MFSLLRQYPDRLRLLLFQPLLLLACAQTAGANEVPEGGDNLTPEALEFFEGKIRPVRAESCYECHNSVDKKKGGVALDWKGALDDAGIIVPGKPTPPFPAAAFRHHYPRLIEAGVEILHHPEMAHAKVATVDDQVFIGGCNLDDLSLFRNDELDVVFHSHEMADHADDEVFDELAAMSSVAEPSGRILDRLWSAGMARLWRLL